MARGKARSVKRRGATRSLSVLFVVVTEGTVTEPEYLRVFAEHFGNASVTMRFIRGAGDPRSIVERAIQERDMLRSDNGIAEDSVWAVFDRDEHARFAEAIDLAKGNSIPLAISNPCFELWGIFHYRDFDAPIDRHDCQRMLEGLCAVYDRASHKSFASTDLIRGAYGDAVSRARNSLVRRRDEGNPGASPCTGVHLLAEHFRQLVARDEDSKGS